MKIVGGTGTAATPTSSMARSRRLLGAHDERLSDRSAAVKMVLHGQENAEKIFELANKAHSLYILQNPDEKAKLLRMLFSNCSVEAVSVTPT